MKLIGLALMLAIPLSFAGQDTQKGTNAANDGFEGTWKLDVAKSKFAPGPAPQSITITIGHEKVSVEEIYADGRPPMNWSYTPTPGGTAKITGMDNSTVTEKRVNERTIEHTWNFGDMSMQGKAVLSRDGKTMTYTLTGTTRQGKPIRNEELYEKQ